MRSKVTVFAVVLSGLLALAGSASAQLSYPTFQVPYVAEREFNFGIADARRTTSLVFQWREGVTQRSQLSLDVGFADADGNNSDVVLLLGGQYGYQMLRSNAETPLDILFTAGLFGGFGDDDATVISIPFGASIGHRFPLEGQMAITPYVHPRISIDIHERGGNNNDDDDRDSELNINFDLGASFDINDRLALRFAASLGDSDAIGFSLAWRPLGLRR